MFKFKGEDLYMFYWKKKDPYSTLFMNIFIFKNNFDLKKIKKIALSFLQEPKINIKISHTKPEYTFVKRRLDDFFLNKPINDYRTLIRSLDPSYSSYFITDKNKIVLIFDHCIFDGIRAAELIKYLLDKQVEPINIDNIVLKPPNHILRKLIMPSYIGKISLSKQYLRDKIDLKYCKYIYHNFKVDNVKKK